MWARAVGLALVSLIWAGCNDEARVIPVGEGVGGAARAGMDAAAEDAVPDVVTLPGALVKRGMVRGNLRWMGAERVIVDDDAGRRFYLHVSDQTQVRSGGQPASLLGLDTGVPVQVWFVNDNDSMVATRIEVGRPSAAAQQQPKSN